MGSTSGTMKNTERGLNVKKVTTEKPSGEITRSGGFAQLSPTIVAAQSPSTSYLKDAAEHLIFLMGKMKDEEVNANNVNAVCNLAKQVANIVRVNIEIKKSGL